ncbi:hypothetical protein B0H12DRAFT_1080353 [Mycena haematopus]|nr:hypothetical protein B0H12DRAFT_1080353 [Mycena haematopus]
MAITAFWRNTVPADAQWTKNVESPSNTAKLELAGRVSPRDPLLRRTKRRSRSSGAKNRLLLSRSSMRETLAKAKPAHQIFCAIRDIIGMDDLMAGSSIEDDSKTGTQQGSVLRTRIRARSFSGKHPFRFIDLEPALIRVSWPLLAKQYTEPERGILAARKYQQNVIRQGPHPVPCLLDCAGAGRVRAFPPHSIICSRAIEQILEPTTSVSASLDVPILQPSAVVVMRTTQRFCQRSSTLLPASIARYGLSLTPSNYVYQNWEYTEEESPASPSSYPITRMASGIDSRKRSMIIVRTSFSNSAISAPAPLSEKCSFGAQSSASSSAEVRDCKGFERVPPRTGGRALNLETQYGRRVATKFGEP